MSCWSTRGSPPVNFSLLLDDREAGSVTASDSLTAWFPVEVIPGLDMGVAQCRMKNDVQELMSEPLSLEVGKKHTNTCEIYIFVVYNFRATFF